MVPFSENLANDETRSRPPRSICDWILVSAMPKLREQIDCLDYSKARP